MDVVGFGFREGDVVGHAVVGQIKVVGLSRELACQGINLLDNRQDTQLLTLSADA